MSDQNFWKSRIKDGSVLNPVDRISEVLFGLIMVLTFTGAISVATDGRQEIRELLWAALGCNVAWGLVDAVMYLMNIALERGHNIVIFKRILSAQNHEQSRTVLKEEFQPLLTSLMTNDELNQMGDRLRKLPVPSKKHLLSWGDMKAGVQIFLLVFLCTLPVALPFAFLHDIAFALRTSNAIALLLLFVGGYMLAGYAGFPKILTAFIYTIIGVFLVALTMALGG